MAAKLNLTYLDYNRESSTASFSVAERDITDPLLAADLISDMDDLVDAVNGVSIGLLSNETRVWEITRHAAPGAAAASVNAQRERKWLVRGYDSVEFVAWSMEIPAADLSLLQTNSEFLDISAGPGLALKDAIEASVVSPRGNPVVVTEVMHVGRNT